MTALERRVERLEVARQITRWDALLSCPVLSWPRVDFEAWATGAVAGDREALAALAGLPDSELQALIETLEAESRT